jgi:REP element-mobilizing transposase RayT
MFSTKYREPLILESIQDELFSYLSAVCKNLECYPLKIGGHHDHVHILCTLSKNVALKTLLEEIKSHSSKWMKTKDERLRGFYWQNGYGAFSVRPSDIDIVTAYIQNQKEHHQKKSFQDEYRTFLKKYNVEFDERYVWD